MPPSSHRMVLKFPQRWIEVLAQLGNWEKSSHGYIVPPAAWLAVHPGTALGCSEISAAEIPPGSSANWSQGTVLLQSWMASLIEANGHQVAGRLEIMQPMVEVQGIECDDWALSAICPAEYWPALTHEIQQKEHPLKPQERSALRQSIRDFLRIAIPPESPQVQRVALCAGWLEVLGLSEESHQESQSIEGLGQPPHGDYWHAIHHRREPDPGNASYWFRRISRHRLLQELEQLLPVANAAFPEKSSHTPVSSWNQATLLYRWEEFTGDDLPEQRYGRLLQWLEMSALIAANVSSTHVLR